VLIISNDLQQKINELILTIRNTSVSRYANISGSDDGVHWYTIQENVLLDNIANTDGDKFLQHLHFSVSSYKYFKIGIANGKNDPLNIINAGWYLADDNYLTVSTTANPSPSFLQKDSAGISYIFVTSRMPFHTDRIYLRVQAPRFFKRAVEVIILNRSLQHFDISSDSIFVFDVPLFKTTQWQIKIYNGDNPPVKVVAVETSATAKEVITYLETGHHYSLLLSSDSATMPLYDLENFKDSITTARVINISDIKPLATTTTTDKNIFKKNWLWPILISILVLVIFFTWKLSKEVEHKK